MVFRWAVAAALGVVIVVVGAYAVYTVRAVIVRIIIALFIAMSLDPAVRWLVRHRIRRSIAVTVIFALALGAFTGFVWSVAPPLATEATDLAEDLPDYAQQLYNQSETYREFADEYGVTQKITDFLGTLPAKLGPDVFGIAQRFLSALFNVLLIVVLTIYFMADLPRLRRGIVRLVPTERRSQTAEVVNVVVDKVGGYMIGNLIISLFAGISTFVCLSLVGMPFALPLAFFVAITDLIPLVGATIGAAGCVLVALFTVDLLPHALIVLIFFVAYQQLENYLIAPRVLRNTVDLSSVAVLVAALIGGSILGAVGALAAIPVAAAIKVLMTPIVPELDEEHHRAAGGEDHHHLHLSGRLRGPRWGWRWRRLRWKPPQIAGADQNAGK
ncbi:MAG: AI-2E family transporter [Micromonosporaceae bacterium]|nr:AI-2E family transporter [Micromonosporaceae bacterium]